MRGETVPYGGYIPSWIKVREHQSLYVLLQQKKLNLKEIESAIKKFTDKSEEFKITEEKSGFISYVLFHAAFGGEALIDIANKVINNRGASQEIKELLQDKIVVPLYKAHISLGEIGEIESYKSALPEAQLKEYNAMPRVESPPMGPPSADIPVMDLGMRVGTTRNPEIPSAAAQTAHTSPDGIPVMNLEDRYEIIPNPIVEDSPLIKVLKDKWPWLAAGGVGAGLVIAAAVRHNDTLDMFSTVGAFSNSTGVDFGVNTAFSGGMFVVCSAITLALAATAIHHGIKAVVSMKNSVQQKALVPPVQSNIQGDIFIES